ncbi:MAG: 16S rRNA processing protein RimM [Clostridia bacterium]|nr:16S rRNA processing protein RimM [Clostridia bacterium]
MNDKEVLEIGQIVNTRGLRGEVKVNSFSEDPKRFEKISQVFVKEKGEYKEYEIQRVAYAKNQVILKLKGIDHIDYAEKLRGLYVYILRSDLRRFTRRQVLYRRFDWSRCLRR